MMVWRLRGLLEDYLRFNFYPPIRDVVIESWVKNFTEYWEGEIDYDELIERCPVPEDELLDRFDMFVFPEDWMPDLKYNKIAVLSTDDDVMEIMDADNFLNILDHPVIYTEEEGDDNYDA